MTDVELALDALYASVVEDEGTLFIGFAEGEDEDEPYVLIRSETPGAAPWLEMDHEDFGAHDAIERIEETPGALVLHLRPACRSRFSFAAAIRIRHKAETEGMDEAKSALVALFGAGFQR